MFRLVIASHGSLAEGMCSAAKMILNSSENIIAYGLDNYEDPEEILRLVRELLEENPEDTFFILCDIKGGSVCNQLLQLLPYPNARLFSGVNLSMVLLLATLEQDTQLDQAIADTVELSRKSVSYFDHGVVMSHSDNEEDELW